MNKGITALATALCILGASIARAQSNSTPTDIPIPPAVRAAMDAEHVKWKQETAAAFSSGLTYVKGIPVVMLMTDASEGTVKKTIRKQAIIEILDKLLDDDGFDIAHVCIVYGSGNTQKTTSYEVRRSKYVASMKKAANLDANSDRQKVRDAVKATKSDFAPAQRACAELGID
jgi:hypothetical protein